MALLNNGVHSGIRFILMAAHTEHDIDDTVEATERALTELRSEGLV